MNTRTYSGWAFNRYTHLHILQLHLYLHC